MKKLFLSFACLIVVMGFFFFVSCGTPKNPVERIGWDFMDAYYVNMDLSKALALADGVAADKIRQSEQFREGFSPDASAHRPRIDFEMTDSQILSEEATLLYDLSIHPEKSDPRKQRTRLKLRLKNNAWKVTQFSDF
jgi:hypothetical protein